MSEEPDDDTDDRRGDPFEQLDESVGDREGDPFEELDDGGENPNADSSGPASSDPEFTPGQFEPETTTDRAAGGSPADNPVSDNDPDPVESEPGDAAAPMPGSPGDGERSEMSFGIGRRESTEPGEGPEFSEGGDREGDPFGSVDSAFAEMDVEQVDPDTVWQELTSAQSRGSVGDVRDRTYADVSKHSYCEQCEHFSEPPDVHCTHEGTEIVEFLDMETVRVVDCPIVAEREKLEEE